jgi:uncharacterized membrane protein YkvA (DUF1232 family)
MPLLLLLKTIARYWRMSQDPRTPPIVRGLIYAGLAATIAPKKILPKRAHTLGLLDQEALAPAVIALAMVLIPKRVKKEYDRAEKAEIKEEKAEGAAEATAAEAKD